MDWWRWRVHVDEKAAARNQVILEYCQDEHCSLTHYGYNPFHGREPRPLAKWDFMRDSRGKVGK